MTMERKSYQKISTEKVRSYEGVTKRKKRMFDGAIMQKAKMKKTPQKANNQRPEPEMVSIAGRKSSSNRF